MVEAAKAMARKGSNFRYVNPGFGPINWCCVTVCSYWVYEADITGTKWVMGSSNQPYFWSPRYGGDTYDDFLIDNNFIKMSFKNIGRDGLRAGDILQANDHSVTVVQGDEVNDMTYSEKEMLAGLEKDVALNSKTYTLYPDLVRFIRAYLNFYGYVKNINTKWGKALTKKIKKWQKNTGLPVTGEIDTDDWKVIRKG